MIRRTLAFITVFCASFSIASGDVIFLGPSVSLDSLLNGMTFEVGDKLFSDFSYAKTENMPAADAINVIAIQSDGNYGVRFQGGFLDLPGGSTSDALITFTVTVTDSNRLISDAHLAGNTDLLGGSGLGSVTETFLPDFPNDMLTIYDDGQSTKLTDWIDFAQPVRSLKVQKNIILYAGPNSVGATMSFVDQTFSQVQIPEPSTAGLLLLAAAGLLGLHGRR